VLSDGSAMVDDKNLIYHHDIRMVWWISNVGHLTCDLVSGGHGLPMEEMREN